MAEIEVSDTTEIESLSGENPDGHFRAGESDDIVGAGVDPRRIVYAIVR